MDVAATRSRGTPAAVSAAALVICCCGIVATVRADEASGTWSGSLEGRGNYYWERSTRVIIPAVRLGITAPNGMRMGAGYLVDAISSASIAQTGSDIDAVFTEYRHGPGVSIGQTFDFRSTQLDVDLSGSYSTENDYNSLVTGAAFGLALDEKATRLSLSLVRVQDEIRSNADPSFEGELLGTGVGVGLEQVINPVLLLTVAYQFGHLAGFLGNPYRRALLGPLPVRERHPDERFRHNVSARLAWYIPPTRTAVNLVYRAYVDSWDIAALTPELRVYQQIGSDLLLRPRYRFYAQTKASFQRDSYPAEWTGPATNDPKMDEFTTHTVGLAIEYRLGLFSGTVLDFARNAWIDLGVDRYFSTSRFGGGVIATAGGRVAF